MCGCAIGSNRDGAEMSPASVAACSVDSSWTGIPKYVSAAACTPYAPLPKYTSFRYRDRIWFFVS